MDRFVAVLLSAAALAGSLAGCAQADLRPLLVDAVAAPTPILRLTPMEVVDAPRGGSIKVAWGMTGAFALDSHGVPGLPAQAVREGQDLFVREAGGDWAEWDVAEFAKRHPEAASLLLFDVADALRRGVVVDEGDSRLVVSSDVSAGEWRQTVRLDVQRTGGHVTRVAAEVEDRPSGGFVLRATESFPFEPGRPLP